MNDHLELAGDLLYFLLSIVLLPLLVLVQGLLWSVAAIKYFRSRYRLAVRQRRAGKPPAQLQPLIELA